MHYTGRTYVGNLRRLRASNADEKNNDRYLFNITAFYVRQSLPCSCMLSKMCRVVLMMPQVFFHHDMWCNTGYHGAKMKFEVMRCRHVTDTFDVNVNLKPSQTRPHGYAPLTAAKPRFAPPIVSSFTSHRPAALIRFPRTSSSRSPPPELESSLTPTSPTQNLIATASHSLFYYLSTGIHLTSYPAALPITAIYNFAKTHHTTKMGALGNLVPLVILFLFVGGAGWIGYQVSLCPPETLHQHSDPLACSVSAKILTSRDQIYLYTEQLAERGVKKMEKKNVVFTKDGAKVGVKEVRAEDYADRTQKMFVKTWNAAQDGGDKKKT
jgi:hypothetical protein